MLDSVVGAASTLVAAFAGAYYGHKLAREQAVASESKRVSDLKAALRRECELLRGVVPQIKDRLLQHAKAYRALKLPPALGVRGPSGVYSRFIGELAPYYTPEELALLHFAHETTRAADLAMERSPGEIAQLVALGIDKRTVFESVAMRHDELSESITRAHDFLDRFIKGEPAPADLLWPSADLARVEVRGRP